MYDNLCLAKDRRKKNLLESELIILEDIDELNQQEYLYFTTK